MLAIIDYDAGNIRSVEKACRAVGSQALLTRDPERILSADHIILPGVGSFGQAIGASSLLWTGSGHPGGGRKRDPLPGNLPGAAAALFLQPGESAS